MSQQGLRQASVRTVTGTTYDYNGDWSALFTAYGLTAGDFNGRLLAWINISLGTSYTELNGAMQAFATANNAYNWSSMGTFYPNPLYAYGVPAFLFDVPLSQYKNGSGFSTSFSSLTGLTFTRALAAYAPNSAGVLQLFASGAPRITDRGLLIEGARTNLFLRSQEFDNATWTKTGGSITANATNAPDDTATADLFTEDTSTGIHRVMQAVTLTAAVWTAYWMVKPNGRTWVYLYADAGLQTAYVNLATGAVGTTVGTPTITYKALANGFYLVAMTWTNTTTTSQNVQLYTATGNGGNSYTGDGVSGMYVWGGQCELGAFPSSYIPTTSASVLRPADVCSIAVSGISYPATLFWEGERVVDTGASEVLFQVGPSANEECFLYVDSSDRFSGQVKTGGVTQANEFVTGALAVGTTYRGALRVASNDVKAARGGTLSTGDTSSTNPSAPTAIILGNRFAQDLPAWGFIKRAAVWNGAFTDAQLQAVST